MITSRTFSHHVLAWFQIHGRKDLPWQKNTSPYRVWVSEIMLQQTQVNTVIPYFEHFLERFPTIQDLASASLDEVLHLWSGLGYYSRARNMHQTAKMLCDQNEGIFFENLLQLQQLPGIGRSTAGAILSLGMERRAAILDGNVKRLLARFHAIDQPVTENKTIDLLWNLAEQYLPSTSVKNYNQALMDLGALICTRTKPCCDHCPLQPDCLARKTGRIDDIPCKKTKNPSPIKRVYLLILMDQEGKVLLEKRPPVGIWGGLWSFPLCDHENEATKTCHSYGLSVKQTRKLPSFFHTFSHCRWNLHPVILLVKEKRTVLMDVADTRWISPRKRPKIGLPKPIQSVLKNLEGI